MEKMSLSDDEEWIPMVSHGSSIPELIKYLKHSFRECEFNEVQKILMDREKSFKLEMENLIRDRDSIKEETRLLEKTQGLEELEKLKLEEKLQKCLRKCEKMKETIARLTEEQRVSLDKAKKAEERCDIVSEEKLEIVKEKNELISELNDKIDQLKNKNLENERLVGEYQEKIKGLDMRIIEYDQAEIYKSGLQVRINKVEAALAKILNVKVEDLGNLAEIIEAAGNGENVCRTGISKGGSHDLANADDVAVVSPGVRSTCNSTGSGGIGLPNKDCRNLVLSPTKEDGTDTVRTSAGTQPGCSRRVESDFAAQDNEDGEPLVSGSHPDGGLPIRDKSRSGDIIEIHDSDDEWDLVTDTFTTSDLMNKRNRGDSPVNVITKRRRIIFLSDGEDDSPIGERGNQVVESSHDVDSEDETYSDSHMEDLVATLQRKYNGT